MTTPGPVASQVAVPTKVGAGARDTSAKSDAAPADGDSGFGEVLTKLQRDDAQKAGSRRGEPARVGRQDADAQRTVDDGGTGRSSIDLVLDSLAAADQQLPGDPQPDAATGSVPASNPMTDIIAAVAVAQVQSAPAQQSQAAPNEKPAQAADPATAAIALLEEKTGSALTVGTDAMAESTPAEFAAPQTLAATTDPALARAAARGTVSDKGKADRKASDTIEAAPVSTTFATVAAPHDIQDASPPPRVSVVQQEAHFAPVAPTGARIGAAEQEAAGSGPEALDGDKSNASSVDALLPSADDMQTSAGRPAQQIADRILAEAGTAAEFADRAGMTPEQPGMRPMLKVLHIQLQPADMGTVTVRMELKNAELTLQVEADHAGTADLIRNDQDTLSNLLRASGYNVDSGSVRVVGVDPSTASQSAQTGAQSGFQSSAQSHSGASERQGQSQQGSAGTSGTDTAPKLSRNDSNETNTNRAGRGLYL